MTTRAILLLALSAILAIAYGAFGSNLYEGAPPFAVGAVFKASSIIVLALIALWTAGAPAGQHRSMPARAPAVHNKLLAAGLLFGALGDALLAWSPDTFLYGALAFLIGHLFYITLFIRTGIGDRGVLREPVRIGAMLVILVAAVAMTSALVPRDSPLYAPLGVYTGVLAIMTMSSFTLPATRWLAMAGAVLFFISDGFVAWNMFHPDPNATLAFWRSFAGWMIYWAGQAAICVGALGLHKTKA